MCVAFAVSAGSVVLLGLNTLIAAFTCGDDGPLDYGNASSAEKRLCQFSFDTHLNGSQHFSRTFTIVSLLALVVILLTGTLLALTRRRSWLVASLAVLVCVGMSTLVLLAL